MLSKKDIYQILKNPANYHLGESSNWVSIQDLVNLVNINIAELVSIVKQDPAQKYEFSTLGDRVRIKNKGDL